MSASSSSPEPARAGRGLLRAILFVLTLAAAAAALLAPIGRGAQVDDAPAAAPGFRLPDLRDPSRSVALTDFAGRPVVINFFASWCVPCRKELPVLQAAAQRVADVHFVAIDHADVRSDAIALLDRTGVTFPAAFDPEGEVAGRFRLHGLPSTAFVDGDGRLVGVARGALTSAELDVWVARLRKDGTG